MKCDFSLLDAEARQNLHGFNKWLDIIQLVYLSLILWRTFKQYVVLSDLIVN
jgi:hypothetical protein